MKTRLHLLILVLNASYALVLKSSTPYLPLEPIFSGFEINWKAVAVATPAPLAIVPPVDPSPVHALASTAAQQGDVAVTNAAEKVIRDAAHQAAHAATAYTAAHQGYSFTFVPTAAQHQAAIAHALPMPIAVAPQETTSASKKNSEEKQQASYSKYKKDKPTVTCTWPHCQKVLKGASLKRHMRIHTQEKPYKCLHPTCDFTCNDKANCIRHYTQHVRRNEAACETCNSFDPLEPLPKKSKKVSLELWKHIKEWHIEDQRS